MPPPISFESKYELVGFVALLVVAFVVVIGLSVREENMALKPAGQIEFNIYGTVLHNVASQDLQSSELQVRASNPDRPFIAFHGVISIPIETTLKLRGYHPEFKKGVWISLHLVCDKNGLDGLCELRK